MTHEDGKSLIIKYFKEHKIKYEINCVYIDCVDDNGDLVPFDFIVFHKDRNYYFDFISKDKKIKEWSKIKDEYCLSHGYYYVPIRYGTVNDIIEKTLNSKRCTHHNRDPKHIDGELLKDLYTNKKLSNLEIQNILRISRNLLHRSLSYYKIPKRTSIEENEVKKNTFMKRYGVENPSKNKEFMKKRAENNIKKYGETAPQKLESYRKEMSLKHKEIQGFMTTEEWIKKARSVHGKKYDYSKVDYKPKEKVEIICPIHGSFFQRADSHLQGCGCKKCSFKNKKELLQKN